MIVQKMSKITLIAIALGVVSISHPLMAHAKSEAKGKKRAAETQIASKTDGDDSPVRAQIAQLSKSLAEGDAKSTAALWTEDGSFIDSDGGIFKGRVALEKRFSTVFTKEGRQMVDLQLESVKFLTGSVASAEGMVRRKDSSEGPAPETRFSIVFVKQDGNWLISTASETPLSIAEESDPLKPLSWLVGEWLAENNGGYVKLKADWAANKNFIVCQYETKKSADAPQQDSRQVIGWDPRNNEPISWHFDSSGGFGWGSWIKKDNQWMVDATGVERDGSTTAATNVLSPTDANNFSFQSVNRSINGIAFNDTVPLKVHRVVK